MKKFVFAAGFVIAAVASVFAVADSAYFFNKPEVPAELKN